MTDNLIERLQAAAQAETAKAPPLTDSALARLLQDAANEIVALGARIARLEGLP